MTSSRRASRKSPAVRRQEIVEAVLQLLSEGGTGAVSTVSVTRRVGLTQSAFFKHFPNKQAVWQAVMEHIAEEMGARLARAATGAGSHTDRIKGIIHAYLKAMLDIPAIPALLFSTEVQAQAKSSYLREEISQRFGRFHAALLEQIKQGCSSNEFRSNLDAHAAAILAAGVAQSLLLRWRISGKRVQMLAEAERVLPILLSAFV